MAWLFSAERPLQRLVLHAQLGEHLLQALILFLDRLHLSDHEGGHASELRPPTAKGCGADRMLPAKIRNWNPTFGLAQDRHDLHLGKSTLLHSNLLVDVTEKILLPNPLQKRGGLPCSVKLVCAHLLPAEGLVSFALPYEKRLKLESTR